MTTLWDTIVANSTLPVDTANTFYDHLNNQNAGTGVGGTRVNGVVFDTGASNDPDAIHDNVAAEIQAIAEKAVPIGADLVVIEDNDDSHNKKSGQIGNVHVDSGYF